MSDDTTRRGPPDPARINVNQSWELRYWSEKLGVTEQELRRAVEAAGVMVEDVRRHLGK
jgi:hypothetical protein